jgi:hypothetical protein
VTIHLVQRREQPLVIALDQGQKINTRNAALKNIGGKEKGDNMTKETKDKTLDEMSINELVETNAILNDNSDAVAKQLKTAHNYYDVKNFITVVQPHDQRGVILCPGTAIRELADHGLRACSLAPVPLSALERLLLDA